MDVKRPRPWQEADSQGDQPAPAEVPTVAKQAGEAEPPSRASRAMGLGGNQCLDGSHADRL